jgi:YfdX protein
MTDTQAKPTLEMQRNRAEQQARPDLEKWRNEAEQQALKTLDKDAIAAIEQTVQAIDSIAAGKTADALKGIEEATGKVNIVLARNPELALIPVSVEALIIDTAPRDIDDIEKLADAADKAILVDDFPTARALLGALRSEVRVRTYNLPLGIYPTALQEAARLLDKDSQAASIALLAALNTLVTVDQVTPLPLLNAQEAINQAQTSAQKDKNAAQKVVETAEFELNRAMALGYVGQDPEYPALKDDISNLKKQLKGSEDTTSAFSKLKARLGAFLKRKSDRRTSSTSEQAPKKAA